MGAEGTARALLTSATFCLTLILLNKTKQNKKSGYFKWENKDDETTVEGSKEENESVEMRTTQGNAFCLEMSCQSFIHSFTYSLGH